MADLRCSTSLVPYAAQGIEGGDVVARLQHAERRSSRLRASRTVVSQRALRCAP